MYNRSSNNGDWGMNVGETYSNHDIIDFFKCGNMGGMRRSLTHNALILISDHTKGFYVDTWSGDVMHYTGMGKNGDQSLDYSQNKTLANSRENGVELHFFEVFEKNRYIYQGLVELINDPYQRDQLDIGGHLRKVWVFDLKRKAQQTGKQGSTLNSDLDTAFKPSTYLLTWNPALWEWVEYNQFLDGTIKLPLVRCWSTQSHKNVKIGDEVFLMLLDENPEHKGIIAWGYVTQEPFEDLHWDKEKRDKGIKTYFIQCTFHEIINIEKYSALRRHQLINAYPDQHWAPQGSGIQIQEHIAQELKEVWKRHYDRNSDAETNSISDEPIVFGSELSDAFENPTIKSDRSELTRWISDLKYKYTSGSRMIIESRSVEPLTIERVEKMVKVEAEYLPENDENSLISDGNRFQRLIEINTSISDMDSVVTGNYETRDIRRLVDKIFCEFPLIGNYVLTKAQFTQLIDNSKDIIARFFQQGSIDIEEKAILTLTLICLVKENPDISSEKFWRYFINQLGYYEYDRDNRLYIFLSESVFESLTGYNRLFIRATQNRDFRTTLLAHAMSPKKDWYRFFDFIAEFYRNNLDYSYEPNDRMIDSLSQIIQEKYIHSEIKSDDIETKSLFGIHIGLVSIMVLRPNYMTQIIHQVLSMLDRVTNQQKVFPTTYLHQLFNQWHRINIQRIAFVEKEKRDRQSKVDTRHLADYSRIFASWCVDSQNNLGVTIPSFRVNKPRVNQVRLNVESISESRDVFLNVFGNSFGKTCEQYIYIINEATLTHSDRFKIRVKIFDDTDVIYDSGTSLYRDEILIEGQNEVGISSKLYGEYLLFTNDVNQYRFLNCSYEAIDEQRGCYFLYVDENYSIFRGDEVISTSDQSSTDVLLYAEYYKNIFYDYEGITYEVAKYIDPIIVQLKPNQKEQSIIVKINQDVIQYREIDQVTNRVTYNVSDINPNTPLTLIVYDQTDQRVMLQKRLFWIVDCEVCFDQPYYWLNGMKASGCIRVSKQILPLFIESEEFAYSNFYSGRLRIQIPVLKCFLNEKPVVIAESMIWYEDFKTTDTLKVIIPGYRTALVAGDHLIVANSSDDQNGTVYPLGVDVKNMISHRDADVVHVRVKLNTRLNQNIDEIVLYKVYFKPQFVEPVEITYDNRELSWNAPLFMGGTGQLFLEVENESSIHQFEIYIDSSIIIGQYEIDEGVHSYQIFQQSTSFFSSRYYVNSGSFIVGDFNRFRFVNKRLHLTCIRISTDSFQLSDKFQTYISDLIFQGMGKDPEISGEFPTYLGKIYYDSRYEKCRKIKLLKDFELNEDLDINSVRVLVINHTTAYITDADGDGLIFNTRVLHLVDADFGNDPAYLMSPDFFDYQEEEDTNVQPNQSIA
jgi:hypothetical protein